MFTDEVLLVICAQRGGWEFKQNLIYEIFKFDISCQGLGALTKMAQCLNIIFENGEILDTCVVCLEPEERHV